MNNKCEISQQNFLIAIKERSILLVEKALADGFNPNFKNPGGYTPLMIASGLSYDYIVKLLLEAGADANILDNRTGNTALHFAAIGGSHNVTKSLLKHDAFIDIQNPSQGHTPLIDAVIYKNPSVVSVLLEHGANINIKNNWGYGAEDFIKDLLEQPNTEKSRIKKIHDYLEERKARDQNKRESMRLFKAVLNNDIDSVRKYIQEGDDINEKYLVELTGDDGHTPLMAAARDGRGEITEMLLKAGADPYIQDYLYKAFPIHKSCYMGQFNTAEVQVRHGVDINIQGPWNGYTPLHDALWQGHVEIAKLLINSNANLEVAAHNGKTPLDIAIEEYGEDHPIVSLIESKKKEVTL